jgi:IMP dehydrogenase
MDFVESVNPTLAEIMKPRNTVITAPEGIDTDSAYQIMRQHKVKKLPIVSKDDTLIGMYVWSDVKQDKRKRDYFSLGN